MSNSPTNSLTVFKQDGSHQFYCRWTAEEDRLLAKAVEDHGPHKWTLVSKLIPGRTAVQCSTRWFGALNPNVHKGRWSKPEDQALTEAVRFFQTITPEENSLPWNKISENIPNRTGIQCQARWTEALDPAIRKGRWNPEEDRQLKVAIAKYGCCWIRVASLIPTRTQRQCRTRWNQIHSQQIKTSPLPKSTTSNDNLANKRNNIKYAFMPPTFPSDASEIVQQENPSMLAIPSPPTIDDIIFSQTLNITMDDIAFYQYLDDFNSYQSSSCSTSSRSSFGSASMCPSSTIFPVTPVNENQTYQHTNNQMSLFEDPQPYQDFLSASDLEVLLDCLSSK